MRVYFAGGMAQKKALYAAGISYRIYSYSYKRMATHGMKIYFADSANNSLYDKGNKNMLGTYHRRKSEVEPLVNKGTRLFLDSGAFSAWTKGVEINIDEYISFIKRYQKKLDVYSVLDDINNPEKTWSNQKYMEEAGLNPLPVFHYGEELKYLERCMDYEYFALGGMVPISAKDLTPWLNKIWARLVDKDGFAIRKVHGFGLTTLDLIKRYPWYSVDSTSWVMTGRFGAVFCQVGSISKIAISEKGNQQASAHFNQLPEHDQKNIEKYFKKLGYTMQELREDYKKRDEVNILYFLELEKQLTENPPRFQARAQGSLF